MMKFVRVPPKSNYVWYIKTRYKYTPYLPTASSLFQDMSRHTTDSHMPLQKLIVPLIHLQLYGCFNRTGFDLYAVPN